MLSKEIKIASSSMDSFALPIYFFSTKEEADSYWNSRIDRISELMEIDIIQKQNQINEFKDKKI